MLLSLVRLGNRMLELQKFIHILLMMMLIGAICRGTIKLHRDQTSILVLIEGN